MLIPVLVNVAFITLFERKILGYAHLRKGPNKVRIAGILQPFNDAIKLFSKENIKLNNLKTLFTGAPGVYTRVTEYLHWIYGITHSKEAKPIKTTPSPTIPPRTFRPRPRESQTTTRAFRPRPRESQTTTGIQLIYEVILLFVEILYIIIYTNFLKLANIPLSYCSCAYRARI